MMSETGEDSVKRRRKPNWSQDQLLLLAQFVLQRRGIIKGNFGSGVRAVKRKEKREAGEGICLSTLPAVCRCTEDCQKRWFALQSQRRLQTADLKRAAAAAGPLLTLLAFIWDMHLHELLDSFEFPPLGDE